MRKLPFLAVIIGASLTLASFKSDETKQEKTFVKKQIQLETLKKITPFELGNLKLHKVEVKIGNTNELEGIAKYEDLIPSGFTVSAIYCNSGKASFDSEKAEVTFFTLKQQKEVSIVYFLESDLNITPKSDSYFKYTNGDEVETVSIIPN